MIKFLLGKIPNININTAIIVAVSNNRLNIVELLISNGADLHTEDDKLLRLAARYRFIKIFKFLIGNAANIHTNDDEILSTFKILQKIIEN